MSFLRKISIWYYIGLLIWAGIITLRKFGIIIPLINNYFTDLYSVPMYCYTLEILMNKVFGYQWKPDLKFILWSVLYLTLIFEVTGPLLSTQFTGDIFDAVCYLIGGVVFFLYRKSLIKQKSARPRLKNDLRSDLELPTFLKHNSCNSIYP